MNNKMYALVKELPQKGLWLREVDVPQLQAGEALIKIKRTAICGTDLHIYNWDEWSQATIKTPMTIGHEFVGEIVKINGDCGKFKIGDIVSAEGHVVCGTCRACRAGKRHLCPNTRGIGVNRTGIFAQYAAIPVSNLWLCDPEIDLNISSIFDPLGNAVHTALSFDLVGEDVLITGAGPIGIMAAAICKHTGARKVVITDISDYRLELAKKIAPAAITVNTLHTNLKDVQKQIGMVEGFDVGLEMSGSGIAFNDMISNMINGGRIAMLGILKPDTKIDWNKVVFGSLFLKGIYGREMYETWYKMTAMLKSGLDIGKIITHTFNFKDFEQGFELMNSGKSGKIVLNWE